MLGLGTLFCIPVTICSLPDRTLIRSSEGSVPSSRYGSIALFQKSGPRYRRQHSSKGAEDDAPSSPPSTERTPLLSDQGMSSTPKK